jgi:Mn2+/Fe2+ NRAMP family transporter
MPTAANLVILCGLLIGLVYGAVGLLSGFCMMSGLRGWWAQGDSRLVRTYALAMGVAIAATQLLAVRDDLSATDILGAADVFRRRLVRLRHGAIEWLRLAGAGAARPR